MERVNERARLVVAAIIEDLKGRSGFDMVWVSLDKETREEVEESWHKAAVEALEEDV